MSARHCPPRKPWKLPFQAEPKAIAGLRRVLRTHLNLWGLPHLTDNAQLCVTEIATNVVKHVGEGTPAVLAATMSGPYLRLEVHDSDPKPLPPPSHPDSQAEHGRGLEIVAGVADRWGVEQLTSGKSVWIELHIGGQLHEGHTGGPRVTLAEAVLRVYGHNTPATPAAKGGMSLATMEEAAVDLIADLLHWLRAHGYNPTEALDRAHMHFDTEINKKLTRS